MATVSYSFVLESGRSDPIHDTHEKVIRKLLNDWYQRAASLYFTVVQTYPYDIGALDNRLGARIHVASCLC